MTDNDSTKNNPLINLLGSKPEPGAEQAKDSVPESDDDGGLSDLFASADALEGTSAEGILDPTVRATEIDLLGAGTDLSTLATMDMSQVAAIKSHADRVTAASERFLLKDAESFRTVADALDTAMQSDQRFDTFGLASVRNYVMSLMTTMSRNEELASILLDKDIRNCILFARRTYEAADESDRLVASAKRDNRAQQVKRKPTPKAAQKAKLAGLVGKIDISGLF